MAESPATMLRAPVRNTADDADNTPDVPRHRPLSHLRITATGGAFLVPDSNKGAQVIRVPDTSAQPALDRLGAARFRSWHGSIP
jgi:hypothetical protein